MESFNKSGANERPLSQIADIVREYETRPDRPKGHIVSRYVAEAESEVFAEIANQAGLTTSELWKFIEDGERRAARPLASEAPTTEPKRKFSLKRLEADDESTASEKMIGAADESDNTDAELDD